MTSSVCLVNENLKANRIFCGVGALQPYRSQELQNLLSERFQVFPLPDLCPEIPNRTERGPLRNNA